MVHSPLYISPSAVTKCLTLMQIKSKPPAFLFRLNTLALFMNLRASLCRMADAAWSCDFPGGGKTCLLVRLCCVPPPCYPTHIYIKALLECLHSTSRPSFAPAGFLDEISEYDWREIMCFICTASLISMIQSSNLALNWSSSAGISYWACSCGSMLSLRGLEHLIREG